MLFNETVYKLRAKVGISQEKLAEALSVSRQAIQKWESGASMPDIENLVAIAKFFDVSVDYLLSGIDSRDTELLRITHNTLPTYSKQPTWEAYFKQLPIEYRQCLDEGKDVSVYEKFFNAVNSMPDTPEKDDAANIIFRIVENAPPVRNYKYTEPSELDKIFELGDGYKCEGTAPDGDALLDKIHGGWLGRICGCLLGKPVEGIHKGTLDCILKRTGNYPLHRYLNREEMTEEVCNGLSFPINKRAYPKDYLAMPVDDDTNYIVLGYRIIKDYGREFTAADVASAWLKLQSKDAYCTAERVAFRNFVNGYLPPASAHYKNPYREWIGAQIRGDYFGYINPCNPKTAADMAFRDASISHVKNGIYGEMWASAMIACAFGSDDIKSVIRGGLAYVPKTSRLYEAVNRIIDYYDSGMSYDDCMNDIRTRWNEADGHDWCHTISNAEIVAMSLLFGKKDYGKTICMAVTPGFDTDCNAATAGSVLGVMLGAAALPAEWTAQVGDTLHTSIFGVGTVSISEMAKKTLNHLAKEEE